jgi:YD repeat-containing protein
MTADGSAVMHWMGAGTPHEMITMFHMDKSDLLATHYCAAHNQPRLRAVPSNKPGEVAFEFKDGTNIRPGDGYMRQLAITFVNANHHNETWGYDNQGKIVAATFNMTRVKTIK